MTSKPNSSGTEDYFCTDNIRSGLRKRVLKGVSFTVCAQAANFTIQTSGTIILARLLTPNDFGLVSMVVVFSLLLQNFGISGFTEAVVQKKDINHRQISTFFWINVCFSLALMTLFICSSSIIVWFYDEPRLKPIVIAMAASIGFAGFSTQHMALLIRNMHFNKTSAITVMAALSGLISAIVMAYMGFGYWALVAKWVVTPLVTAVCAWTFCKWRPGIPARGTGIRSMLKFASSTWGIFFMLYFSRTLDKMLIGKFRGSQELGSYDRAYQLSMVIPLQLLTPISNVAISAFSRIANEPEKYRHNFLLMLGMLAFVGMPMSAVLTLTSKDLVLLLLGSQWSEAGRILAVLGPSVGVAIIYYTHGWMHISLGTPQRWFRWGVVALIVTSLLLIAGVQFGALGVAVAYSASFYILMLPSMRYAGQPISLSLFSVLSMIWRYYISALCAGLLSWFLLYSYATTSGFFIGLYVVFRLMVATVLCSFIYLVFVVVFYQSFRPITQVASTLREIVGKKS